jgi:hypothetical protein
MKLPKNIFMKSNGVTYLQSRFSGIHPLICLMGEFPVCIFPEYPKLIYIKLDDVIAWYKKETNSRNLSEREKKILNKLNEYREEFEKQDKEQSK